MRSITRDGRTWHFVRAIAWDSIGTGVRYPQSVAVAADGAIFVLSRGMPHHQGLHPPKLGKWTIEGNLSGDFAWNEFSWPTCVAVAGDGNVYAADESENFIAVFGPDGPFYPYPEYNPDGEYLSKWGGSGSGAGQLDGPSGLAFDAEDNLYVVDSRNDRVQKFTKDGKYLMGWGTTGDGEGQFNQPWGITIDKAGDVYVADWGNHRVQKFRPDGTFLMTYGSPYKDGTELEHPAGVAVDSDGDVYVTDWGHKRVQIYEPDGDIIATLRGDATDPFEAWLTGPGPSEEFRKAFAQVEDPTILGRFDRPIGIAVDDQDRVYVVDCRRSRVQIYSKDYSYVPPPPDMF